MALVVREDRSITDAVTCRERYGDNAIWDEGTDTCYEVIGGETEARNKLAAAYMDEQEREFIEGIKNRLDAGEEYVVVHYSKIPDSMSAEKLVDALDKSGLDAHKMPLGYTRVFHKGNEPDDLWG